MLKEREKRKSKSKSDAVFFGCTKLNPILFLLFFSLLGMLRKVTLELTVLDYDRIGGSDPIGKVRLGYSRKKLEKKHWAEMVENPRRPVIHWHVLQVKLDKNVAKTFLCSIANFNVGIL